MERFSLKELEAALSAAATGVWSWRRGDERVRISAGATSLLGLPSETRELREGDLEALIHAGDVALVRNAFSSAWAETREPCLVDFRVRETGNWLRCQGRALVADDGTATGVAGILQDISAPHELAQKLERTEEGQRLFAELASDYIYVADVTSPALAPSIVAGGFERTTGYTPDEVAALGGWMQVIHEEDRAPGEDLVATLMAGKPFVSEYRIRTKSGELRWLRDRAHPTLDPATGALTRITGAVQNITDRKLLEDQLRQAQKMEALANLAGAVAHDLNNVLTVVYITSKLLSDDALSSRGREALTDMGHAAGRAADLTRSLLTFGRRQVPVTQAVGLAELATRVAPIIRHAVGERVELKMGDDARGAQVAVDVSQLELAVLNLAVNARDAMPQGGTLTVHTGRVEFSAEQASRPAELSPGTYGVIEVTDTGAGIPAETLPRIFEPFFTTKQTGKGTGLGLATVHGVVRQHGGAITVRSRAGSGTTFSVYLPLSEGDASVAAVRGMSAAVGGTERVLVVEDDPAVRRVTVQILEELGYAVQSVGSAEDAIAQLEHVDVVLSDVRLPGMSGTELALKLRGGPRPVGILLMSGLVEDAEQRAAIHAHGLPFLPKPFTAEGLARRLREALAAERKPEG